MSLNSKTREQTLKIFTDKEEKQLIKKAFDITKGWVTIRVVGSRADPIGSFFETLNAIKARYKNIPNSIDIPTRPSHKNLINLLDP